MHLIMLVALVVPPSSTAAQDWLDRLLEAAQLPVAAAQARDEGVSNLSLGEYLERVRRNRVSADDAWRILDEEVRVVRSGGPKENFGAFVQSQLDAGLRGRALANAIHEEHRRRGMGRPDDRRGEDRDADRRRDDDRPDQPGRDQDEARRRREAREREADRERDNRPNQSRDTTRRERP